jgi:hypothetical protein
VSKGGDLIREWFINYELRTSNYELRMISCLFFFLVLNLQLSSQGIKKLSPSDYQLASLKDSFGKNKQFIPEFELQTLIALSFYSELNDTRISFKLAGKESMAKTTISFFSLILQNKHIIIYINNNRSGTGLIFNELPFNAQIGVIGHELAHAVDFMHKNLAAMIWWGVSYINKNKRVTIERSIDLVTIQHGLGWQLYDFSNFVIYSPNTTTGYKIFRQKYYLHPEEIMQQLNRRK